MSGFNPVSNATSNLPQSHVTHYDRVFVENLKAQTPAASMAAIAGQSSSRQPEKATNL
jgi:hypothetical protein